MKPFSFLSLFFFFLFFFPFQRSAGRRLRVRAMGGCFFPLHPVASGRRQGVATSFLFPTAGSIEQKMGTEERHGSPPFFFPPPPLPLVLLPVLGP